MILKLKELLFGNFGTRQTVAKNIFWLTIGQVGTRLLRASVIIYAARALGAAEYGVFSYVLGLAGFFTIFADIGINTILTKEAAMNPEKSRNIFATSFWIKAALLGFTALLIIFAAPHFSRIEAAKPLLYFAAILTVFDGIREFAIAFFRAKEKMELETLVTTVTNAAITALGFAIIYFRPTAGALVATYALSAGTGAILGIFVLRDQFRSMVSAFRRELLSPILRLAWPIALVSLMGIFTLNVDVIMLGIFKTATDVGFYSASQRIIQLLYTLPSILAISFYPVFAKFVGQGNTEKVRELMERGITASYLLALPIAVGGIILGGEIIRLLYGSEYAAAVPTFRMLLLSVLLVFPGYHLTNYIMVHDEQKKAIPIILIGSLANVFLNYLLIPPYGTLGAAIATVLALLITNGSIWVVAKRISDFSVLPRIKKIVVASLIMGLATLCLHWLNVYVLANIAVSVGLYFGILYLLRENSILEIKSLIKGKGA